MYDFWNQDSLALSLQLTAIIVGIVLIILAVRRFNKRHSVSGQVGVQLAGSASLRLFRLVKIIVATAGVITLYLTMLPGLTPFAGRVDGGLGLGGISLFFLWPIIALQAGLYWLPLEKHAVKTPASSWILMLAGSIVLLMIDDAAIRLVFN